MAEARCAMALDQSDTAIRALQRLKKEFPDDPEVLYIMAHYLSQIASRMSQQLAVTAPNSSQAQRLEAEVRKSKFYRHVAVERGTVDQLLRQ